MKSTRSICRIEDCTAPAKGQKLCSKHYQRLRKNGDPLKVHNYADPAEGFRAKTRRDGECLIWTGHKTEDGYGRLNASPGVRKLAHRYAWENARGPIPDGLIVDHMCHRPACCNIEHLRLVTDKQNSENPSGPRSQGSSGYLGVHQHGNRWRVRVRHYGVTHLGGSFATAEEAAPVAQALRNKLFTHNLLDRIPA